MLKSPHPTVNLQCQKNTALRVNPWAKLLVVWGLVAIGNILYALPLLAAPPAAGTTIDNKATGTFVDGDDLTNLEQSVQSNTVTITVAKVAGITVGAQAPTEAPSTVTGAGPYQNFPGIQTGDVVYFDFIITNTGNDVTQFTIPSTATVIGGGTVGTLQIIGYNNLVFDGLSGNPNPVNIPTSFDPIANSTGKLLATTVGANRGSVAVGGTIKVRVPVTISASAGSNVTVLLGNTDEVSTSTQTPKERLQNQTYIDNSSTDVYTLYSPDTGGGGGTTESADPPANGSREASAITLATVLGKDVSGNVFDDVNYGGGVGRSKGVSGGQGVNGARVELYDSTGKFVRSTITDNLGDYTFPGVPIGDFFVRVVNNTVVSSRSATGTGLVPVQTFRTNAATGTITTVTNRVGGEKPAEVDAPANTTATLAALNLVNNQEVQSLTAVKVGSTALTGIDFGYNFDTIVNTNDSGQGSLRQFITNSNALTNTGLAQVGQPAGKEVSIFMISDGTAHPGLAAGLTNQINGTGGNSGAAVITSLTSLPTITDASTWLDASTQKTNVGNNASSTIGTGGTVGVDKLPLSTIPKPSVMLNINATDAQLLNVNGSDYLLKGFGAYGAYFVNPAYGGRDLPSEILIKPGGSAGTITQLLVGTLADGSNPGITTVPGGRIRGTGLSVEAPNNIITNNYFAYASDGALILRSADGIAGTNGNGATVTNNEFANSDYTNPLNKAGDTIQLHAKNAILRGNLIRDQLTANPSLGYTNKGIEIWFNADSNLIENNTIHDMKGEGIGVYQGSDSNMIRRNVINNNGLGGIVIAWANVNNVRSYSLNPVKNTISQNSIFNNTGLGIDLDPSSTLSSGSTGDGVSPNDGLLDPTAGNNGMDYPILISSSLRVNAGISTLSVTGYVGNLPAGRTTFDRAVIEFFVGATDTNDRGKVFSTDPDTVSKIHAEGQTYLGSCNTDANGLFGNVGNTCTFNVPTGTEPLKITSTATDLAGNTSEFSAAIASNPNLLLVKRITAINGGYTTKGGDNDLAIYKNTDSPYDDNVDDTPPFIGQPHPNQEDTTYWPTVNSFLKGGTDGGLIKPNDSIEYTIYFLSAGDTPTNKVLFCDRVPVNVTFIPSAFNNSSITPDPAGLSGIDRGIAINLSGTLKSYTNAGDGDLARYFPPTQDPIYRDYAQFFPGVTDPLFLDKKICDGSNTNGAVIVNLGTIPNATSDGEAGTYGFVRFRGQVK